MSRSPLADTTVLPAQLPFPVTDHQDPESENLATLVSNAAAEQNALPSLHSTSVLNLNTCQ
jgi:hypothetical protein